MSGGPGEQRGRKPRRTVAYQGLSSSYFGFTEFALDRPLPHAAGIYILATDAVGPDRWRAVMIGEAADFSVDIERNPGAIEARRRGSNRVLLHFSPLDRERRLDAAKDLWMALRSPLVSWNADPMRRTA